MQCTVLRHLLPRLPQRLLEDRLLSPSSQVAPRISNISATQHMRQNYECIYLHAQFHAPFEFAGFRRCDLQASSSLASHRCFAYRAPRLDQPGIPRQESEEPAQAPDLFGQNDKILQKKKHQRRNAMTLVRLDTLAHTIVINCMPTPTFVRKSLALTHNNAQGVLQDEPPARDHEHLRY